MLTVFLVASLLVGLGGCHCAPPVWEGPPISLPKAEHAYAVPVRAAAMARTLPQEKLDKLIASHCVIEPEMEAPIEEEEFLEEEIVEKAVGIPVEPPENKAVLSNELAQGSLLDALSELAEPGEIEALGHEFSASLEERLPTALVVPAILTITLEEIRWLGDPVIPLEDGRIYPASNEDLSIPRLYEALDESVDHTLDVAQACGKSWGGSVLLAIDARVPLSTVYPVMYTLGQARFSTFLFMVSDPDPVETRSHVPAGGLAGSGKLTVTPQEYRWQKAEDTGLDSRDERTVKTTTWAPGAPWPSELDLTRPPRAVIVFELNQLYGTLMGEYDRLAQHNVFCAVAAFPEEQTEHPVNKVGDLQPITPVTIDPRGTVAVHVNELPMIGGPHGEWEHHDDFLVMRGDGSRCSPFEMRLSTRETSPPSQRKRSLLDTLGLSDSDREDNLTSAFEPAMSASESATTEPGIPTIEAYLKAERLAEAEHGPRTRISVVWTEPGKATQHKEIAVVPEICWREEDEGDERDWLNCWFAGGGSNLEVRRVGDALVVERQYTDEISEESPIEEVARIPLAPSANAQRE